MMISDDGVAAGVVATITVVTIKNRKATETQQFSNEGV
jgi:predicted phosphoribosyltransferase